VPMGVGRFKSSAEIEATNAMGSVQENDYGKRGNIRRTKKTYEEAIRKRLCLN